MFDGIYRWNTSFLYVTRCVIRYHLYNVKNVKSTIKEYYF